MPTIYQPSGFVASGRCSTIPQLRDPRELRKHRDEEWRVVASKIDLSAAARSHQAPDARWHPVAQDQLTHLYTGQQRFCGIPFDIPDPWLTLWGSELQIPVAKRADYIVIAHAADVSSPSEPTDRYPGQISAVGELLADYVLVDSQGDEHRQAIRRRYEIGEVVQSWGHLPFAARPQRDDRAVPPGIKVSSRYFGMVATGVLKGVFEDIDHSPSKANWWIYALRNPVPHLVIESLRVVPRSNTPIAIGGLTAFTGDHHPLQHEAARTYAIPLPTARVPDEVQVEVDLGVVGRRVRLQPPNQPLPPLRGQDAAPWPPYKTPEAATDLIAYEITATPDATLTVDGERMKIRDLRVLGERLAEIPLSIVDADTGQPIVARVNVRSQAGITLPPMGHPPEANVNWFQVWSPDIRVGELDFAYVDKRSVIQAPLDKLTITAGCGFEYEPFTADFDVAQGQPIVVPLKRSFQRGSNWMTADTHVHFLSPITALLEADAEDVDLVNLLAAQWGDLYTNIGDLGDQDEFTGRGRVVKMGSENRQHHLSHLSLLGTGHDPIMPLSAAGPQESGIGDPVWSSITEWAEKARDRGGLAIAPHFPEPYSEVVAAALRGSIDAVELRFLGPNGDSFDLLAWYALLAVGLRIPCAAGSDKMSGGTALGGVRTYARIDGEVRGFDAFASAVRAGRTLATNGPFVDLTVEGREPGASISLPSQGGRVSVDVAVHSVLPHDQVEIVYNGEVVAQGGSSKRFTADIPVLRSGWIAARVRGRHQALNTGWHSTVAAHTSPVYLEVGDKRAFDASAAAHIDSVLVGGLLWLDTLAVRPSENRLDALKSFFLDARNRLAALGG
jgi:hypothetical protein